MNRTVLSSFCRITANFINFYNIFAQALQTFMFMSFDRLIVKAFPKTKDMVNKIYIFSVDKSRKTW